MTASPGSPRKTFPFAKQSFLLRKPEVISKFYTGMIYVVLTVNTPVKTRYFSLYFNGTG